MLGELGDVGVHVGLQRLCQLPPGTLPHKLIDQQRLAARQAGVVRCRSLQELS
jgi:hypothetical protein